MAEAIKVSEAAKAAIEMQKKLLKAGLQLLKDQVNRAQGEIQSAFQRKQIVCDQLMALENEFPGVDDYFPKEGVVVLEVAPSEGRQGQSLEVKVTGFNFAGATAVSFGAGIEVVSGPEATADGKALTVGAEISATAAVKSRDVKVTTPEGQGVMIAGFAVVSEE